MPSRRLPETDDQRSAALGTCNLKYQATAVPSRLITPTQFSTLGGVLSPWRAAREFASAMLQGQTNATALAITAWEKSVRVNSHFIQVVNFAIERDELPASVRAFYGLPVSHASVPPMTTCPAALQVAADLESGEAARIAPGGVAMAWPTITQVTVAAAACGLTEGAQTTAKSGYDASQASVATQRPALDLFIKDLWDTIEYNLRTHTAPSLRREAREWGVVYQGAEEEEPPAPPVPPVP